MDITRTYTLDHYTQGDGTCDLVTYDKSGNPAGRMILGDCSYAPSLGVNLICVKQLKQRGATVDIDKCLITLRNGTVLPFDDDFSMRVVPTPNGAQPAVVAPAIYTRGKNGPTHDVLQRQSVRSKLFPKMWA